MMFMIMEIKVCVASCLLRAFQHYFLQSLGIDLCWVTLVLYAISDSSFVHINSDSI